MQNASGPPVRVVHADQGSARDRLARVFAAECAAAALEVFQRQRRRDPRPSTALLAARRARDEEGSREAGMSLLLLIAPPPRTCRASRPRP